MPRFLPFIAAGLMNMALAGCAGQGTQEMATANAPAQEIIVTSQRADSQDVRARKAANGARLYAEPAAPALHDGRRAPALAALLS